MGRRIRIGLAVVIAGLLVWLATSGPGGGEQHSAALGPAGASRDPAREDPAPGRAAPPAPSGTARELEALPDDAVEQPDAPPDSERASVEGRVLDLAGEPVAQLDIAASTRPDAVLAASAWDGSFALEMPERGTQLVASGEGWATVRAAALDPARPPAEAIIVVAPAVALAGKVVDPRGAGIAHALVSVEEDWRGLASFPLPLDRSDRRGADAATDAEGRFRFEAAPLVPGGHLVARAQGYVTERLYLPEEARDDLVFELQPIVTDEPILRAEPVLFGSVRFPDGEPAPGARVQLASAHATTDELGSFEFELPGWYDESALLVAMLAGWQSAVRDDYRSVIAQGGPRVGPIELVLPGPELAIAGRLTLADGAPAEGWRADLLDPTVLDAMTNPAPTLERRGLLSHAAEHALTGADGRFRIGGLADRRYRVRVWHPKLYISVESGPVPAGTEDLELEVPADAVMPRFTGRVLTQAGLPVEGAQVSLRFVLERTSTGLTWQTPARAFTDADGRFELEEVPRRGVDVVVSGDDVESLVHELPGRELPQDPLELRVWRTVHVRFDFSAADPLPDAVRLLDAQGTALSMTKRSAGSSSSSNQLPLQQGRAPVVSVSERAATLVLEREREELARRPVHLVVGEVNELGP